MASSYSYLDLTVEKFIDQLSSGNAVPGGGSASALIAALGCSLLSMVATILSKRKSLDEVTKESLLKVVGTITQRRKACQVIVDKDPAIFEQVLKAYQIDKLEADRLQTIDEKLQLSFQVMCDLSSEIVLALEIVDQLREVGSHSIMNDLILAETFLQAALKGAIDTAKINIDCFHDDQFKQSCQKKLRSVIGLGS